MPGETISLFQRVDTLTYPYQITILAMPIERYPGTLLAFDPLNRAGKSVGVTDTQTRSGQIESHNPYCRNTGRPTCRHIDDVCRLLLSETMNCASAIDSMASAFVGNSPLLLPLRRSHPRYPVQKIASYQYEGKRFLTLTVDLALKGVKIKVHRRLFKGERLDFKLVLDKDPICLDGRIVYSESLPGQGWMSGVAFLDISERDQKALTHYLDTLKDWPGRRDRPLQPGYSVSGWAAHRSYPGF